jgi:hypothetical protein
MIKTRAARTLGFGDHAKRRIRADVRVAPKPPRLFRRYLKVTRGKIMKAEEPKRSKKPIAPGTYAAWTVGVYDNGIQPNVFDPTKPPSRKMFLTWELAGQLNDYGEPVKIGRTMPVSTHEKSTALPFAEAIIGRKFTDADRRGPDRLASRNRSAGHAFSRSRKLHDRTARRIRASHALCQSWPACLSRRW